MLLVNQRADSTVALNGARAYENLRHTPVIQISDQ